MKINRMTKGEWGKKRAFFDLETEEGIIIKGFSLVTTNDDSGLFVGLPSKKTNDEYKPTIYANETLRSEITKLAHDEYNNSSNDVIKEMSLGDIPI